MGADVIEGVGVDGLPTAVAVLFEEEGVRDGDYFLWRWTGWSGLVGSKQVDLEVSRCVAVADVGWENRRLYRS